MKQVTSCHKTLTIKKELIQKRINRIDLKIETALAKNDFFEAERLESKLYNLEQELLKTYSNYELKLFADDYSA